ncbi:MAG TPA: hypothetical protein VGF84_13830 [Micromonosporaceae bacterium]
MRVLTGIGGLAILVTTVGSILRNLIVPRGVDSILIRTLWRITHGILHTAARPLRTYLAKDKLLAWLAPIVLLATLLWWLAAFFLAYGLLLYAVSRLSLADSLREAGSSLFTLGFASTRRNQLTVIDFAAAVTGPLVIALQIAYLPTLYNAYNRRETEVTLLQSRASEPAWGPELLARQALVGTVDELGGLYANWERLAADLGESHSNYTILLAFRSPRPYRSWIIALLAVMDAGALHMALAPTASTTPAARLMVRAGFTALRDIARVLRIPFDSDPDPDAAIALTYEEFAEGVAWIENAGFLAERSVEEAWPHFRGWRINYEQIAYALARLVDAVPAMWSGERDWPAAPLPPIRPVDRKPTKPSATS